jgi:chromosome segregation ATPase
VNSIRTYAAAGVAALALGTLGSLAPADAASHATSGKPDKTPCAQEQKQVDKAEDALARVTEVFAHQKSKVEKLQDRLAAATTDEEKARLQAQLDKALAKAQHTKKAKKAQQQRLAKAEQRLADCEADQPAA